MLSVDFEKRFPSGTTVRVGFDDPVDEPAVTVLLGRSGGGKTTILRCLAGLERPERGTITFEGERWLDSQRRLCLPPGRRGIGFLFQDYALFPHMTVEENIGFGLSSLDARSRRDRLQHLMTELQLEGLDRRYPRTLSGGQQQRVALARALGPQPRLLLLDEPLSALDPPTREELRPGLKRFLGELGIPVYLVTHDRLDAVVLGERVMIVERGAVVQSGRAADVFANPVSAEVARLVGVETIVRGTVTTASGGILHLRVGDRVVQAAGVAPVGAEASILIRAEDVTLSRDEPSGVSAQNQWQARIVALISQGGVIRVSLDCGFTLAALVTRAAADTLPLREGGQVWATVKATAVMAVEEKSDG